MLQLGLQHMDTHGSFEPLLLRLQPCSRGMGPNAAAAPKRATSQLRMAAWQFRSQIETVSNLIWNMFGDVARLDMEHIWRCRTPAVIPGAAPPRPMLGKGRRISSKPASTSTQ